MDRLRWGICGCGGIAKRFCETMKKIGGTVVAAASSEPARARAFASEFEICKYGSYEDLAKDPEVDAVYVATNHTDHADCSILYLAAGKPVLCEKPLTINRAEFLRMREAAQKHHALLMEALWTKFLPATRRAIEIAESGDIGEIKYVDAKFGTEFCDTASRAYQNRLAGGALLDLGVYTLNVARWFLKDIVQVSSCEHTSSYRVDEIEAISLMNAKGAAAHILNAMNCSVGCEYTVYGAAGKIFVPHLVGAEEIIVSDLAGSRTERFPHRAGGMEYEIEHFENLVRSGKYESPLHPLSETEEILKLMDGLRADWGLKFLPHEK